MSWANPLMARVATDHLHYLSGVAIAARAVGAKPDQGSLGAMIVAMFYVQEGCFGRHDTPQQESGDD